MKRERRNEGFGPLRMKADLRTVAFMSLATSALVVHWYWGWATTWEHYLLWGVSCMLAVSVCTMTHNHCHTPVWKSRFLNRLQDYWLTLFYGYPVFAWIPTHNMNHHVLNNKEGDASITYRLSEANNLLTLLSYPATSGYFQQAVNVSFVKSLWTKNRKRAWYFVSQLLLLLLFDGVAFYLDWKKALLFVFIPQQISLNVVLIFNYIQHVHTDEESRWDHSRNFLNPLLNFLLFNNGYHTIHHEKPLMHWSQLPGGHAAIAAKIKPELNEWSMWGFLVRVYILGLFFPRYKTHSMRLERIARKLRLGRRGSPLGSAQDLVFEA